MLPEETLHYLQPQRGGVFVDATLGLGGHAQRLLEASEAVHLVGIDQDLEALERARARLAPFGDRVSFAHGSFAELETLLAPLGLPAPTGILADLGVSSLQLDSAPRGFSFQREGPLDMRMDGSGSGLTAAEVVNTYSEADLERIFRDYGEEKRARAIARAIVRERGEQPLSTTRELAELIRQLPGGGRRRPAKKRGGRRARYRPERIDPSTRVFQALRIEVNRELAVLPELLEQAVRLLSEEDGRLVVISYHSLEDRIVKHGLREMARGEIDEITGRPRWETQLIEVLTRKPVRPSAEEVAVNPRSRSARLRAARRIPRP